jgi:hypothetical protein
MDQVNNENEGMLTLNQAEVEQPEVKQEAPQKEEVAQPEVQAAPEWKPNYKVKAYDNEYEIPEDFRAFINQENEKKFRDTFEKAFALDEMKGKYHKTKESYEKVNNDYTQVQTGLKTLGKYLENDDFDSFFENLKIPEKKLQEWMYKKLTMNEMPPEQRGIYQKNQEYLKKQYELEQQTESMQSKLAELEQYKQQESIANRQKELDNVLNRPEIQSTMQQFDSKLGQAGAFRNEVIQRAAFVAQTQGKDLSPEEAVQEVLKIVSWNQQGSGDKVLPPQAGEKKPVLPSLSGKATSPVAKQIKSIEELKKLRDSYNSQQG